MEPEILKALARYNTYANQLVFDVVAKLSFDQFTFESSRSHSNVQRMLNHMRATEYGFLAQCRGTIADRQNFSTFPEIRAAFTQSDRAFEEYVQSLTGAELQREVNLHLGELRLCLPVWKTLLQVLMHANHHRGELSILLTDLSYPLPTLDIIVQFSEEMGQPWPWK